MSVNRLQTNLLKIFLVIISLITGLSIDIYLPSLNAIQVHFDASYAAVQLTMSIYLAGFAIGQLIWGALSDRIGRVKILSMGLTIYRNKNNRARFSFKRLIHDYLNIITHKTFIFCNLALVSAFSSLFAFISNSSHIMIDLIHDTPERYPFFITANAVALFAGGTVNRWLNTRFDSISVITCGALWMMTGAMWMLINSFVFPGGIYGFIGSMAVCSFAVAWVIPNAIAESLTPFTESAGSAAALFGFLRYMAAFFVANMVSYFSVSSYTSLPISILICSAIIYTSMKFYLRYGADQGETVVILR